MIYAAHEAPYTLIIEQDNEPLNPRVDYDNLGKMVCWHRRYRLGDEHDYADPEDFLRDLYRRSVNDHGKRLVGFLKSGKARGSRLEYNRHTHEWELYSRSYWKTILGDSEPDWYLEQSAPKIQLNDDGWFFDNMLDALTIDDLKELLAEREDVVIHPLYLYDHSGLAMSTGSFVGRAVHAEWDSGQVGYIYADREMIQKEYGSINHETVKRAESVLEGEVHDYDLYLQGECYGYRLFKDGDEEDACWGFLGEIEDIKEDIRSYLPEQCERLADHLELYWEDADDYMDKIA
ncbi:MAG: hypothetical protein IJ089_13770 [Clostridia bacterium]|nr:hypothetical protein [Clostridia bacterium]MBQ8964833.1 hypothetical protein [Clostridia bacterium]